MSEDTSNADLSNAAKSMPWNRWVTAFVVVMLATLAVALVLPAIQQAREAALRSQTKNNLKQIGLSVMNYHHVHRAFPPGGTIDADRRGHHRWMYQIMPFLDQSTFFKDVDRRVPWDVNLTGTDIGSRSAVIEFRVSRKLSQLTDFP